MKKNIKRRDFLKSMIKGMGAITALPLINSCFPGAGNQWMECSLETNENNIIDTLTKVTEVYDASIISTGTTLDETRAMAMLERSLLDLTEKSTLAEAWPVIFPEYTSSQKIGIKVNCLNAGVPTSHEFVKPMIESLINDFSINSDNIIVFDRRTDELVACGFTHDYLGVQCYGTYATANDKTGPGYEALPCCLGEGLTYLSKIVLNEIDYMINFAVLKNHRASGITACMKNNYGCIQNPENFHSDFENSIPLLNNMEVFKNKTKLYLVDSVFAVCAGDTSSPADCKPNKLLASLDMVSIDTRSKALIDEERVKQGLAANPEITYLTKAKNIGLGSANIDLINVNL